MLHKVLRLFLVILIGGILFTGCAKFNPFSSPNVSIEGQVPEDESVVNEYLENVDNMLQKNEDINSENADNYSEAFKKKTDSIYYKAIEQYTKPADSKDNGSSSFIQSALRAFYSTYSKIRMVAPIIIIVSVAFGVVGMLFSRYNKGARRFFLLTFIITVPLLLVFIVFGIGVLNNMFLY